MRAFEDSMNTFEKLSGSERLTMIRCLLFEEEREVFADILENMDIREQHDHQRYEELMEDVREEQ